MSSGGGAEKGGGGSVKTPADFLKSIRGQPVVVKLNSGVDYRDHGNCGQPPPIGGSDGVHHPTLFHGDLFPSTLTDGNGEVLSPGNSTIYENQVF
ncbi:uncharacterized protein LOC143861894 isoform X2 [Tasmannia lanceolata]|uniref:uncharacterized protein LOC143861894 isoform X2 n=1 Tax=Tasmannia lanceolata TaxID=3420 RepID=UPI004063D29C